MSNTIRQALPEDADAIARTFLASAEFHARLDPERYVIPAMEAVSARYREGRQHPAGTRECITLVAELDRGITGFIDIRLESSRDPMHRPIVYCHIAEIAVRGEFQNQGIGGQLLRAAEDWGRRHGAEFASLEYHVGNTRASTFYERIGYSDAATIAIKRLQPLRSEL